MGAHMRRLTAFAEHMSGTARRALVLLLLAPALAGCDDRASSALASLGLVHPKSNIGDIDKGEELIGVYGCGSCHEIPGVAGARGLVGPPLTRMGRRIFIAGVLRNTPENMVAWLRDPQKIVPGNAMPTMGLSEEQARDVAAYLENLR